MSGRRRDAAEDSAMERTPGGVIASPSVHLRPRLHLQSQSEVCGDGASQLQFPAALARTASHRQSIRGPFPVGDGARRCQQAPRCRRPVVSSEAMLSGLGCTCSRSRGCVRCAARGRPCEDQQHQRIGVHDRRELANPERDRMMCTESRTGDITLAGNCVCSTAGALAVADEYIPAADWRMGWRHQRVALQRSTPAFHRCCPGFSRIGQARQGHGCADFHSALPRILGESCTCSRRRESAGTARLTALL